MMQGRDYRANLTATQVPPYVRLFGVLTGYRSGGSVYDCLYHGFFSWHTYTIAIWSVVVSFCFSLLASALAVTTSLCPGAPPSRSACLLFALASAVCFPFCLGYHLLQPIGVKTFRVWRRLDSTTILLGSVCFAASMSWLIFPRWGVFLNSEANAAFLSNHCELLVPNALLSR